MIVASERKLEEITLLNLKRGEVTLIQLNEIYNKLGFVFIGDAGRFRAIRKEKLKN